MDEAGRREGSRGTAFGLDGALRALPGPFHCVAMDRREVGASDQDRRKAMAGTRRAGSEPAQPIRRAMDLEASGLGSREAHAKEDVGLDGGRQTPIIAQIGLDHRERIVSLPTRSMSRGKVTQAHDRERR
jgi:hypothetical protein